MDGPKQCSYPSFPPPPPGCHAPPPFISPYLTRPLLPPIRPHIFLSRLLPKLLPRELSAEASREGELAEGELAAGQVAAAQVAAGQVAAGQVAAGQVAAEGFFRQWRELWAVQPEPLCEALAAALHAAATADGSEGRTRRLPPPLVAPTYEALVASPLMLFPDDVGFMCVIL